MQPMKISTQEQLRELYGWPKGRAEIKVLGKLEKHSKFFIEKSPFFILSSFDSQNRVDTSPRGGLPGFVRVIDDTTLLVPDTKGNNRVDSLVNIVETGRVGCLFLVPGIDETLRLNGAAEIINDPEALTLFDYMSNPPKACIKIRVEEVFLHCAKALMRSKLWSEDYSQSRPGFPTIGTMLNEQLGLDRPKESQEEMLQRYQKDL